MKLETNANSLPLAAILADSRKGTFTGLIIRKKGGERGPEGAKVTYGDDLIHIVILTGFKYPTLVQRSLLKLDTLTPGGMWARMERAGVIGWVKPPKPDAATCKRLQAEAEATVNRDDFATKRESRTEINRVRKIAKSQYEAQFPKGLIPVEPTLDDVMQAGRELEKSFTDTLMRRNTSTADHVYETLRVNGNGVRGSRVYTSDKAEETGTIYLQGLMIGRKVIEPAVNGPIPKPKSCPVSAAKAFIRGCLPISRYVSFPLVKGGDWLLNAGGTASAMSSATGIAFTAEVAAVIDRQAA